MSSTVWPTGHYVSGLSVHLSVRRTLGVPICVQRPAKTMHFQQIIMHALQTWNTDVHFIFCSDHDLLIMPTWRRCVPPILIWHEVVFNLDFLRRSLMGTTLRAACSTNYAFSTNYNACIAMPTLCRCAPPMYCWPWPPYSLCILILSYLPWNAMNWPNVPYSPYIVIYSLSVYFDCWWNW